MALHLSNAKIDILNFHVYQLAMTILQIYYNST